MPRKKAPPGENAPGAPHTAAAAALLAAEMEALEAAFRLCLAEWKTLRNDDWDEADRLLNTAIALGDASVRLAEALARLKRESHQRISVERVAVGNANGPFDPVLSSREALKARAKSQRSARDEGEGGAPAD